MAVHYNFKGLYRRIQPLLKHTVDIKRPTVVVDSETGISREEMTLVYEGIEAYVTQEIRAPYLAINNDDTLRVTSYFNVHVKYDVDIRPGDFVIGYRDDGKNISHGFCGRVRYGTCLNRALINIDDTKAQNPDPY
jgi:hypothetical protein